MSDREKTTFGRMIGVMKEEWSLHPIFEIFIDAFVKERNIFILTWKTWSSGPGQRQMALPE